MGTRLTTLLGALFWLALPPPITLVAGHTRWLALWPLLGLCLWGWRRRGVTLDQMHPRHLQGTLRRALRQAPWLVLVTGALALICLPFFLYFLVLTAVVTGLSWGVFSLPLVVVVGALTLLLWRTTAATRRRNAVLFLVMGIVVVAARSLLVPGALEAPLPSGFWLVAFLAMALGTAARLAKPLVLLAGLNAVFAAAMVTFYTHPLTHEQRLVTRQPGVRMVGGNDRYDFRWVQEGCSKDTYWMGSRLMSRATTGATLWRNQEPFAHGKLTADNGVVDCRLKIVVTADQSDGGPLFVLDEHTGAALSIVKSEEGAGAWTFGFSAVTALPRQGWVLASREKDAQVLRVSLRDPAHPAVHVLEEHATHLVPCPPRGQPCFFGVNPRTVVKRSGLALDHRLTAKRAGRTLGPDLALDQGDGRLYVSDFLRSRLEVFDARSLSPDLLRKVPLGVRYMRYWPTQRKVWLAGFFNGWFYTLDRKGNVKKTLFAGRKVRWVNLTRDGEGLLWCAASACYVYRPGGAAP